MIGIAPLRSQTSSWSGAGIRSATKLKQMIPSYGESLIDGAALCRRLRADVAAVLRLQNIRARRSRGRAGRPKQTRVVAAPGLPRVSSANRLACQTALRGSFDLQRLSGALANFCAPGAPAARQEWTVRGRTGKVQAGSLHRPYGSGDAYYGIR